MTATFFGIFMSLIIGFPLVILFVLLIIDKFSNNKFFCKKMGWHKQPANITFDGCSNGGVCPRCGDKVLQDSNGDWF